MSNYNLSIIVLGSPHIEFTIYSVLTRLFEKMHRNQIPCAFLEENPSDQTLPMIKNATMNGFAQTQFLKKLVPEIKQLYIREPSSQHAYIPTSNYGTFMRLIDQKVAPLWGALVSANEIITEVLRENAYAEEIKLYEKLEQLQIHYAGIEAPSLIHSQQMAQISKGAKELYDNECTRITTMVNNTLKEISNRFLNGGVLVISTGGTHAHRLAAHLSQALQASQLQNMGEDTLDINIHPFRVFSSCSKEIESISDYNLELTASLDSLEIKELYKRLPCPDIESREENHSYVLPEIEAIIDNLLEKNLARIRNVSSSSSSFSSSSLFTPLPAHDQLVKALKEYFLKSPHKNSASLISLIDKDKNYSLALRKVCADGMYNVVKLFLKHSEELPIDFNEASKNGNTALTWFNESIANPAAKKEISLLLEDKMLQAELNQPR